MVYYTQRIKEIREYRELTQEQVAKGIGIKQEQYQRYETGKNEMIFYPDVKMPKLTLKGVLSGAWFLVLTLMPVITDIAGEIKWRKSESGI